MQREADRLATRNIRAQQQAHNTDSGESEERREDSTNHTQSPGADESASPTSPFASLRKSLAGMRTSGAKQPWREPQVISDVNYPRLGGSSLLQPFEVMRAIEMKNVVFLMEVRDRAFPVRPITLVCLVD
jgi:hypothetical protein